MSDAEDFDWRAAVELALNPSASSAGPSTSTFSSHTSSPAITISEFADDSDDDASNPQTPRCSSPDTTIEIGPCSATSQHLMARNTRKRTAAAAAIDTEAESIAATPVAAPTSPTRTSPAPPSATGDDTQAEPEPATRPSKKVRLSAKEQVAMLARELEEVRQTLKVAEESVRKYRKYKSMYVKGKTQENTQLIPRPDGERGKKGWTLRKALQLEGNPDLYLTILATVREAITAAGLDWKKTFHRQEASRLTDCYRLIKEQNPYLKRFEGDWPARELVISCMQNKRKTRNRRKKAVTSADDESAHNQIDDEEVENDDEEEDD